MDYTLAKMENQQKIGSIRSAPVRIVYPTVFQKKFIPDDAFVALNKIWSTEYWQPRNVDFYLLKDVFVVSEGLVFTKQGELVPITKNEHSEDETRQARGDLDNELSSGKTIALMPRAILCKQRGTENYGHWLIENLPKAFLARQLFKLEDWPVIVFGSSEKLNSVIVESLSAIGFKHEDIILSDTSPIHVHELIVVDGLTIHSLYISPLVMECMDYLRDQAQAGTKNQIYVPRRPADSRDFEKEREVSDYLRRDGYQEVVTANLPFLDQVRAFKSAERVVGPMGAALTNTAFCRPGTEVVVFAPASARELFFWLIAGGRQLRYYEVRCEEVGEQRGFLPWNRSLRISVGAIENALALVDLQRALPNLTIDQRKVETQPDILTEARLLAGTWFWRFNDPNGNPIRVQLRQDGTILGYGHENEQSWRMRRGKLEILNAQELPTWRFEDVTRREGKFFLRARFLLDPNNKAFLFLEEEVALREPRS